MHCVQHAPQQGGADLIEDATAITAVPSLGLCDRGDSELLQRLLPDRGGRGDSEVVRDFCLVLVQGRRMEKRAKMSEQAVKKDMRRYIAKKRPRSVIPHGMRGLKRVPFGSLLGPVGELLGRSGG